MILCQRCMSRNSDNATTCAQCGSALIPEWVSAARQSAPAQSRSEQIGPPHTARDTLAPAGFSPGAFPFAPDTPLEPSPRASAGSTRIIVRFMLTESGYVFEVAGKPEYLIGRRDSQAGFMPDVDLTDWNGAASGVSRRHAIVRVEDGTVTIEDLGSRNETVRNKTRLLSGKRYPLANGDTLQLGVIALAVTVIEK
jgi:hypothetical protein